MAATSKSARAASPSPAETDVSPAPSRRRGGKTTAGNPAAGEAPRAARRGARKDAAATAAATSAADTETGPTAKKATSAAAAREPAAGATTGGTTGSPRQRVRAETLERILSIAHDRLVAGGADALSLRSVARELGMVSSAVYRYVASREDLLRMLAARAGAELGEAVDAASRSRRGDAGRRLATIARAVRTWALEHPGDFGLLYGRVGTTAAGAGATGNATEPGSGALGVPAALLHLYVEDESGTPGRYTPAVRRELATLAGALGVDASPAATARALLAWSTIAGAVAVEVSGQLTGVVGSPGALFDVQVEHIAAATGLAG